MNKKQIDKLGLLDDAADDSRLESPFSAFIRYEKGARSSVGEASIRESHGEYLFGRDYEDTSDDVVKKTNWTSYTATRMTARLFSRGIMGATFYALGQAATRNQMQFYRPDMPLNPRYPLHYIARFFDKVAAPPIKLLVRNMPLKSHVNKEWLAEEMVTFREKFYGAMPKTKHNLEGSGRSLGHEVVAMTFDFAMGSVGDAWGRQITNALDPNITNSWYRDGHFDGRQFLDAVTRQGWKILTKNQGEDWAAALPYVYQIRWQRQALNNVAPGFKFLSDRVRGGWKVNRPGQIVGSYSGALAIDLQLRFTGYNWYTLMFRDMYDSVADVVDDYRVDGAVPSLHWPDNPLQVALGGVAHSFRYVMKSGIKAFLYMTPSVPFFWMTRVPQGKYKGVAQYIAGPGDPRSVTDYLSAPNGEIYNYFDHHDQVLAGGMVNYRGRPLANTSFNKDFYPHGPKASVGTFDKMFDGFGHACYKAGEGLHKTIRRTGMNYSWLSREYVHDWVNASMSYTPYMIAKTEFALRWDKPTMDRAIYRLLDGAAALNLGEVKGGLSDIRDQIIHPPTPHRVAVAEFEAKERQKEEDARRAVLKAEMKAKNQEGGSASHDLGISKPDTHVKDIQLTPAHPSKRAASGLEGPQDKEEWKHRAATERFSAELAVPPGASIH